MAVRFLILLSLALFGCADGEAKSEPKWKSSYSADECKELMSIESIEKRCGNGNFDAAMRMLETDETQCIPYSPSTEMDGIWVRSFEHSQFYDDLDTYKEAMSHWDERDPLPTDLDKLVNTWFSVVPAAANKLPQISEARFVDGAYTYEAFAVRFLGRKSLCPGFFGHLGASENGVIASEILSIDRLPAE